MNGKWHSFLHNFKLVKFLGQVEKLHVEIKVKVVSVNTLLDVEDVLCFFA